MLILGIESSCDDMAAAVVEDGRRVLSSVVASQDDIHSKYGGIVPELASRRHIESVVPVVDVALEKAGLKIDEIDAIGVTQGPGLVGSILIGLSFAKAVSFAEKKPFVGVNHIEAHSLAAFLSSGDLESPVPEFPFVSLVVSGGHTSLLRYDDFTDYTVLGQTRDDAAGEALDKVAKMLGLGYPGGAVIDRRGKLGNPKAVNFTRPYLEKGSLDFSFSGIKTAAMNHLKKMGRPPTESEINDIAASFQEVVVDVLVKKVFWAVEETDVSSVVACGGVACNSRLRERLKSFAKKEALDMHIPPPGFCSDNAAMIALLAYHKLAKGERSTNTLNAIPSWKGF